MLSRILNSPTSYLLIFIFYAIGLWGYSIPLTGDQRVYLSVALEMKLRSSWLIPYLFNEANFLKPPFQYWMTLLGWKLFGFGLWGALLPSVLALVLTSVTTNQIYSQLFKEKNYLPGILFASSLGTLTYGTTAQMEIWIVLFYTTAWCLALKQHWFTAMIVVGVMAWIKGPLYSVLWSVSVIGYGWWSLYKSKISFITEMRFWLAQLLGVVIGMLWYFLAAQTHQKEIVSVFFLQENIQKLGGNQGSAGMLWLVFFASLLPWILYFIFSILYAKKAQFNLAFHTQSKRFIFFFTVLPALFFTFFPYRVNTYLYLFTPIVAIAVTRIISVHQDPTILKVTSFLRRLYYFKLGLFVALGATLILLISRLASGDWLPAPLAFGLVILVIIWIVMMIAGRTGAVVLSSLCLVSLIRIAAVGLGEVDIHDLRNFIKEQPSTQLAYLLEEKSYWHEFGIISTAIAKPISLVTLENKEKFLKRGGALILDPDQALKVRNNKLNCHDWVRFRKRMRFPLQELVQNGLNAQSDSVLRNYSICKQIQ
jgi:hypothetical protein